MVVRIKDSARLPKTQEGMARDEIDRVNARLRHFRGVAAGVMRDALEIWREIWDSCQDRRSWEEILEGTPEPPGFTSPRDWAECVEKLHLLGTYIDYAKRLCEGSIDHPIHHESEVEACPDSLQSFQAAGHPSITRYCHPKKE